MPASPHRYPSGRRRLALVGAAALVAAGLGAVPLVVKADAVAPADLGRAVLPAGDGWAATGSGTTGGAPPTPPTSSPYATAPSCREPWERARLTPRGSSGSRACHRRQHRRRGQAADLRRLRRRYGYSLDAYLKAYDPATYWGRAKAPSGTQENARAAAQGQAGAVHGVHGAGPHHHRGVPGTKGGHHRRQPAGAERRQRHHPQPHLRAPARTASRSGTRPTAPPATGTPSTTPSPCAAPPTSGSTTTPSPTATHPDSATPVLRPLRTRSTTASSTSPRAPTS